MPDQNKGQGVFIPYAFADELADALASIAESGSLSGTMNYRGEIWLKRSIIQIAANQFRRFATPSPKDSEASLKTPDVEESR